MLKAQTLTALRTFESAGRLMSFSKAAQELCVTTGAVSQQIRKLETELGGALFIRQARSLELTESGEILLTATHQSLNALSIAVENLKHGAKERIVRLTAIPSFAFHWLIPRLAEFHRHSPELRVEVRAVAAALERLDSDFDLAIDYSPDKNSPGFDSRLLCTEALIPVMAPGYREDFDWQDVTSWQGVALLHDTEAWQGADRHVEWQYWLRAQGLDMGKVAENYAFNRVDMAVEAAAAGLGIALARESIVEEALNSGRLVAPGPAVPSPASYWLRVPELHKQDKDVQQLIEWLLSQTQPVQTLAAQTQSTSFKPSSIGAGKVQSIDSASSYQPGFVAKSASMM